MTSRYPDWLVPAVRRRPRLSVLPKPLALCYGKWSPGRSVATCPPSAARAAKRDAASANAVAIRRTTAAWPCARPGSARQNLPGSDHVRSFETDRRARSDTCGGAAARATVTEGVAADSTAAGWPGRRLVAWSRGDGSSRLGQRVEWRFACSGCRQGMDYDGCTLANGTGGVRGRGLPVDTGSARATDLSVRRTAPGADLRIVWRTRMCRASRRPRGGHA